MNLISNIPLIYTVGLSGATETGIVKGSIIRNEGPDNGDITVIYCYQNSTDGTIKASWFSIDSARYIAVKDSLPDIDVVGIEAWKVALLFESFKIEMSIEFDVAITTIDIV